jgi:hypothetical protein
MTNTFCSLIVISGTPIAYYNALYFSMADRIENLRSCCDLRNILSEYLKLYQFPIKTGLQILKILWYVQLSLFGAFSFALTISRGQMSLEVHRSRDVILIVILTSNIASSQRLKFKSYQGPFTCIVIPVFIQIILKHNFSNLKSILFKMSGNLSAMINQGQFHPSIPRSEPMERGGVCTISSPPQHLQLTSHSTAWA